MFEGVLRRALPQAQRFRGPHREHVSARTQPSPKTHPQLFTAKGQRKWKVPPEGVRVLENTTGEGTWIEKWEAPRKKGEKGPLRYVYNYTLAEVQRRAGLKFAENRELARRLPAIRAQIRKDLAGGGKAHQIAMALTLIDRLYLRVGGEDSLCRDRYGATTLLKKHVSVRGEGVRLSFVGKSGVSWDVALADPRYARLMKAQLARVHGANSPVFQHEGRPLRDVDVNAYLEPFGATAKQFRTFHATRLARDELLKHAEAPLCERRARVRAMLNSFTLVGDHWNLRT
jgi:DNA topoisomerase IB